jgi:DTW domain-containing protein YfiP
MAPHVADSPSMLPVDPSPNPKRCQQCYLRHANCLCDTLSPVTLQTHIALVMHRREVGKPSNTGTLALQLFSNSSCYLRGVIHEPLDLSALDTPDRRTWVLFPSDTVEVLTREMVDEDPRPVTLVVPDGSWTQARRAVRREPILSAARHVVPPAGAKTRYRLRQEHVEGGLATAEAVARALGIIEGPEAQAALEALFETKVSRILQEWSGRKGPR